MSYKLAIVEEYLKDPESFIFKEIELSIKAKSSFLNYDYDKKQFVENCLTFVKNYGKITVENYKKFSEELNNIFEKEFAKIKKQHSVKSSTLEVIFPIFFNKYVKEMQKHYSNSINTITTNGEVRTFRNIPFVFELQEGTMVLRTNRATLNYLFNSKFKNCFIADNTKTLKANPLVEKMAATSRSLLELKIGISLHIFNPETLAEFL